MTIRRDSLVVALLLTVALAVTGPPATARGQVTVDPEFARNLSRADTTENTDAFVHFSRDVSYEQGIAVVRNAGLTDVIDLPSINAVYAFGPVAGFEALRLAPEVIFLEDAGTEPLNLETGTWATRARTLYELTGGLDLRVSDQNGNPLDGRGVGIAIVDSGVDGTHPDLKWSGLGGSDIKLIRNFKVVCGIPDLNTAGCAGGAQLTDMVDSDTTSGHGTHVAGIAAGNGLATTGDEERNWQGVAPGASLYGFGAGEGLSIVVPHAAAAYQWIITNAATQNPPIRVVTNSWGSAGAHNPSLAISQLTNQLVALGIPVVWSAGNSTGTGANIQTNTYGNNPTPGVIQVASYNDLETGTRNGQLSGTSSRGQITLPATWPDVSAPGNLIQSACKEGSVTCTPAFGTENIYVENKGYVRVSGTSMAAPHVAGAIAILRQANPNLSPADLENLIEDTAHKYVFGAEYTNDPANPDNTSSFEKGHGLIDVRLAALRARGLPDDFGLTGGAGAPTIEITSPADGATVGRTFQVAGTANTGAASVSTVIADGDGGDVEPPAVDLVRVSLEEKVDGTVTISWQVADTATTPPGGTGYRLTNSIDGVNRLLQVNWDGTTATCSQALAAQCTAAKVGNTFTGTYPASALGADRGAIMFDAFASSFTQVIVDRAPGDVGGTLVTHPAQGQEHVFAAPSDPLGAVNVFVDGNPVPGNPVATGQGAFNWQTTVGPLACGLHTIFAEIALDTNPVISASDSITVRVFRRTSRPTSIPGC
ncbi:MAG TPA: S8 family serine peptidase [Actinomycetota bacterium]|nr:S8 family serine peptidase [Actinomycetota bacterium]